MRISDVVPALAKEMDALAVVTDMSPLRDPMRWAYEVGNELTKAGDGTPLFQVPRYVTTLIDIDTD